MLRLGIQLFLGLSFLSICIVLPANLSGNYADTFNGKVQECTADDNSAACGLDSVAKCIGK